MNKKLLMDVRGCVPMRPWVCPLAFGECRRRATADDTVVPAKVSRSRRTAAAVSAAADVPTP